MSTCPFCGSRINGKSSKCDKCGALLSAASQGEALYCNKCGGTLTGIETKCPFCGLPTSPEQVGASSSERLVKAQIPERVVITPDLSPRNVEVSWRCRQYVFTAALNTVRRVRVCPKCGNDLEEDLIDPQRAGSGRCIKCGISVQLSEAPVMERPLFPLVRTLTIQNKSNEKANIEVEVYLTPGLTDTWQKSFDGVEPGGQVDIQDEVDPKFRTEKLYNMPSHANLHLDVMLNDKMVWKDTRGIKILPYNQMVWEDEDDGPYYPLLRCFVTPNDQSITQVVGRAKPHLQKLAKTVDFVGYQCGAEFAKSQVQALYQTLKDDYRLSYTNMPPNFGSLQARGRSQIILLPREVLNAKAGNCAELSTLFASCIERVWIDPVVFIVNGHAFPGYFTRKDAYRTIPWYADDPWLERIHTLINEGALVAFEATEILDLSFEEAVKRISDKHRLDPGNFLGAVNLRLLRDLDYKPLPM